MSSPATTDDVTAPLLVAPSEIPLPSNDVRTYLLRGRGDGSLSAATDNAKKCALNLTFNYRTVHEEWLHLAGLLGDKDCKHTVSIGYRELLDYQPIDGAQSVRLTDLESAEC